jgi:hypothetical protein
MLPSRRCFTGEGIRASGAHGGGTDRAARSGWLSRSGDDRVAQRQPRASGWF